MSYTINHLDFAPAAALGIIATGASATLGVNISWAVPMTLGILLSAYGVQRLLQRNQPNGWMGTEGTLIETAVVSETVREGNEWVKRYYPSGRFRYTVYGNEYESHSFALDKSALWSTNRADAEELQRQLNSQSLLPVYVNPQNPAQAVVFPISATAQSPRDHWLVIGGLAIAAIGLAAAFIR